MPDNIDRLLQRLRRSGAIVFSFLTLAACAGLPSSDANLGADSNLDAGANIDVAIETISVTASRRPPPIEITPAPTGPADLLDVLRAEFALSYEQNRRIEVQRDWYVRHPDYLNRVFTRSQRYMPHIRAELERRGLPVELALLPIVESAYDPFAYSHGRAAGLWQMIPGTARRFGIKQNWWYDGRRDIVDSTRAALDYLDYLHGLNDGDWLNAIASYNSGEGNVLRAVRRNKSAGRPTDFWNLSVPKETSAYVPKLLALVDIVKDPAKYNLSLPVVPDEVQFAVSDIESQLDLALAAELAGVDVDTVYAYNPGYNRWSTDPAGPHSLLMPIDVSADFEKALAAVPASERVRWKRHKIGNGETISEIAEQYHTTPASIRTANNLRGNTIRAGHHLMIPVSTRPLAAYSQSADARLERTQNRKRSGNKFEHIVKSGESFWTISRRYKVTTRQLSAWNGMAPGDTLSVGKKLVVWSHADIGPRTSPTSSLGNTTRKLSYTVRNGDSLYLIAKKFRISINELARWNNIDKDKILRPGQRLTMYVDVTAQSS
ncbi:MAG: LysM peptidoglycan-binding domain-containing protein [Proteobacteria bacterium]|nr:LysM peptidoglycan-binding domain-containing protein [Pseudomonadota bacterium]